METHLTPGKDLRIAVVGAGAIGGICAGLIHRAGHDVQVVVRRPEHAGEINEKGLRISGIKGEFTAKVSAVHGVKHMNPDRNLILLATKATALDEVAETLKSVLSPGAMVVSLQNGFCEEYLASVLGRDRVIGCVTGWGATMHAPCHLEMTSQGDFIIGNIDNLPDPRLKSIQSVLNHVLETRISDNITGSLYSKLIINSCITSMGAVCGLFLGQMLARRQVRSIFLRIMKEAVDVAKSLDIHIEVFAGKLNFYTFFRGRGILADLKRHIFLRVLGLKYSKLKSSSLQSLERGEKTEVAYLTGFICNSGRRKGVPTPVNDQVLSMVREIEQGRRPISMENLRQIRLG